MTQHFHGEENVILVEGNIGVEKGKKYNNLFVQSLFSDSHLDASFHITTTRPSSFHLSLSLFL